MKKFVSILLILGSILYGLCACQENASNSSKLIGSLYQGADTKVASTSSSEEKPNGLILGNLFQGNPKSGKEISEEEIQKLDALEFGDYYIVLGKSTSLFPPVKAGEVKTYGVDILQRPIGANATLDYQLIQKEKSEPREKILVDPVGWKNNREVTIIEPNARRYHGFFYNRSHLLADSLGGSPTKDNLITGTRTQNVGIKNDGGGMAYTETIARDFFKNKTTETLSYQVLPLYGKGEVVPRYVLVSIHSSDNSVDETVCVPNRATGFEIDYKTGDWKELKKNGK